MRFKYLSQLIIHGLSSTKLASGITIFPSNIWLLDCFLIFWSQHLCDIGVWLLQRERRRLSNTFLRNWLWFCKSVFILDQRRFCVHVAAYDKSAQLCFIVAMFVEVSATQLLSRSALQPGNFSFSTYQK